MPSFSKRSQRFLNTCHPHLIEVMNEVVKIFDISIIEGHREEERQDDLFRAGKSRVKYPNSKHNSTVSRAVDIAPYIRGRGIDWEDTELYHYMAGIVMAVAHTKGYKLRWGGDWNMDQLVSDEEFRDLGHFELDE